MSFTASQPDAPCQSPQVPQSFGRAQAPSQQNTTMVSAATANPPNAPCKPSQVPQSFGMTRAQPNGQVPSQQSTFMVSAATATRPNAPGQPSLVPQSYGMTRAQPNGQVPSQQSTFMVSAATANPPNAPCKPSQVPQLFGMTRAQPNGQVPSQQSTFMVSAATANPPNAPCKPSQVPQLFGMTRAQPNGQVPSQQSTFMVSAAAATPPNAPCKPSQVPHSFGTTLSQPYRHIHSQQNTIVVSAGGTEQSENKRKAVTPRQKVADNLASSIEKLKRRKLEGSSDGNQAKCRKKLSFGEHSYAKQMHGVEISESAKLDAETAVKFIPSSDQLSNINQQLKSISNMNSILFKKTSSTLSDNSLFSQAILELQRVCPLLFQVLLVAFSEIQDPLAKIATIGTVYGMIMHSRNNKVSAIQRLYSTLAIANNADNTLLTKLNKVHLTLTENSKPSLIKTYGQDAEDKILQAFASGKSGKLNGDNLDIRVQTNDVRLSSKDRDYHFFATDLTMDRITLEGCSKTTPDKSSINPIVEDFIPNKEEYNHYKETLKLLVGRELMKFDGFSWLKSIVPDHIHHDYMDDMSKKSDVFVLPVSLNNEAAYQDCIHIMDEYENYLNRWYSKAGRTEELEHLSVPVGGDQLTRVRLQGAKALRAGAHTQSERFDHLHPIIIEMFHTLQNFLEKLCKKFLNLDRCRDQGTIANLKTIIQRVNVNGNVKSRFKAHEDFIITCGKSYLHSYILWKFKMESMDDFPKHPSIKENIKHWNNQPKSKVFHAVMDEIVAELFIPFDVQVEPTVTNSYTLNTYAVDFLQWFFVIIQMKDAIKEGDMHRTNIILKHMVPFFYSHSNLSKYLVECIDYILKTEHTLSPYMALKVRAASFVNIKGRPGKNKAADLQKENEVKYLKTLIRSLGSNKTEKSIVSITKAGPVILDIANNFDEMTGSKTIKTSHKQKSQDSDINMLIQKLNKLKVWDTCQLPANEKKNTFEFDRGMFKTSVRRIINRLMMDLPVVNDDDE